jgi:hypothetical protein
MRRGGFKDPELLVVIALMSIAISLAWPITRVAGLTGGLQAIVVAVIAVLPIIAIRVLAGVAAMRRGKRRLQAKPDHPLHR